jgi:hypothetical protein
MYPIVAKTANSDRFEGQRQFLPFLSLNVDHPVYCLF